MAVINFEYDDDGSGRIKAIYREGKRLTKGIRLELPSAIVQTYFKAAFRNCRAMTENEDDREDNRHNGLQSFLMSLVGLEAFLNIHFHMVGREKSLPEVIKAVTVGKSTVESKIKNLSYACYNKHLTDQKLISKKIRELYDLRSAIVHPKWEPMTLGMAEMVIDGMSDNFQQVFEDREFVREAMRWCLLVVVRVGLLNNPETADLFMKRWTTFSDTNETLSRDLGICPEGS
jgi:hypothetical protein